MKTYIGIDPGLKGGVAAVHDGFLVGYERLEVIEKSGNNTVDTLALEAFIYSHHNPFVVVEKAQKISVGINGIASVWHSYGRIAGMLDALRLDYHVIRTPREWQREFWHRPKLPKGEKFDTKAASIEAATMLFPGNDFLPTPRSRKPSDGITDAALIAEYGRRMEL